MNAGCIFDYVCYYGNMGEILYSKGDVPLTGWGWMVVNKVESAVRGEQAVFVQRPIFGQEKVTAKPRVVGHKIEIRTEPSIVGD